MLRVFVKQKLVKQDAKRFAERQVAFFMAKSPRYRITFPNNLILIKVFLFLLPSLCINISILTSLKKFYKMFSYFGPLAQWLEQGTHNPLVLGSSPRWPSSARKRIITITSIRSKGAKRAFVPVKFRIKIFSFKIAKNAISFCLRIFQKLRTPFLRFVY